jgi:hypothetical protein
MEFLVLNFGESLMSLRISKIHAIKTYGSTVEIYYGKRELRVCMKGNEEQLLVLLKIFGLS